MAHGVRDNICGGGALTRDRHGTCGGHYQEINMANVGGGH